MYIILHYFIGGFVVDTHELIILRTDIHIIKYTLTDIII